MTWFLNLRTGLKLGIGFGICLLLSVIIGTVSVSKMAQMNHNMQMLFSDSLKGTEAVFVLSSNMRQMRTRQYQHTLAKTDAQRLISEQEIDGNISLISQKLNDYERMMDSDEERRLFNELKESWNAYMGLHDRWIALSRSHQTDQAVRMLDGPMGDVFIDKLWAVVSKVTDLNHANGQKYANAAFSAYSSARTITIFLLLAAIGVGIFGCWYMNKLIATALNQLHDRFNKLKNVCIENLSEAIDAMARGDLTAEIATGTMPIDVKTKDEFGELANTFNAMLDKVKGAIGQFQRAQVSLQGLIREVAVSAQTVASTSVQLSSSALGARQATEGIARIIQDVANAADQSAYTSQEIARGSEQQASSASEASEGMSRLQETIVTVQQGSRQQQSAAEQASAGMNKASQAVHEVARSAQQMASAAQQASSVAQTGGQAVEQTVASMNRIQEQVEASAAKVKELGEKGQQIGMIVETIGQIAEQTNLLALNAAIEAARAGEHGKGFAVVAGEVRKLAERAAGQTKGIADLVSGIQAEVAEAVKAMDASHEEVSAGAVQSQEAGQALKQILGAIQSVATEVDTVMATAKEVSASVEEVLSTVVTVREIAQANEQSVEEAVLGSEQASMAITSVASVSQQTAAGAEQMSAAAKEVSTSAQNVSEMVQKQSASVAQVSASAGELQEMAEGLQQLVSQFRYEQGCSVKSSRLAFKPAKSVFADEETRRAA